MKIEFSPDFKFSTQCRARRRRQIINIPKNATIEGDYITFTGEGGEEYRILWLNLNDEKREQIQKELDDCDEFLSIWI